MMVKFITRYSKEPSVAKINKIKEQLEIDSLLQSDDFDKKTEFARRMSKINSFDYDYVTFDMLDVKVFLPYDKKHTFIILRNGLSYILKLPEDQFGFFYQDATGKAIKDYTNVKIINTLDENDAN